jgi:gliding motility-associated-like protein
MSKIYLTIILLLLSISSLLAQSVVHVTPTGAGSHTGVNWVNAMTLAEANAFVNATASANGFELRLLAGVYQISQTFTTDKVIKIFGGYNGVGEIRPLTSITNLDGLGQNPIANFSSQVSIDRVNFVNGYSGDDILSAGALVLSGDNFSVTNCFFKNNTYGGTVGAGAVFVDRNEEGKIENCSFQNNKIIVSNGSVSNAAALNVRIADRVKVLNCRFENNSTPYSAAAIYLWGEDNLVDKCIFIGNTAKGRGAAINMNAGKAKILNSKFDNNQSEEDGGAINTFNDEMYISNCTFSGNSATRGGAIYNISTNLSVVSSLFNGNTASQIGGAIYTQDNLSLVNSTLVNNTNSALGATRIDNDMTVNIYNSIFYQNTVFENKSADLSLIANAGNGTLNMNQNIVQDFAAGANNQIGVNPQFVSVAANNYRLLPTSPAVNAGLNSWFAQHSESNLANSVDLSGDSRLIGTNIDLGAFEFEDNNVKAHQTITAPSLEKTYGDPDFTHGSTTSYLPLSYTSSDNTIASIITVSGQQRIKINKVGSVNITVSQAGNAQFDAASNVVFSLKVNPKTLNLSATASNKMFDGNAIATATLTDDRVAGDDIALSFTASFENAAVGTNKTVTVTGITLTGSDAANYVLASTSLNITANITPQPVVLTVTVQPMEKVYGDADPVFIFQSSDPTISFSGSLARALGEDVGTYDVLVGNLSAGPDVIINFVSAKFTISKATIVVTPTDQSFCMGQPLPNFSVNYEGFKFGETEADLAVPASINLVQLNISPGTHDLVASGASDQNYDFVYNAGKFTVFEVPEVTIRSSRGTTIRKGRETVLTTSPAGMVNWDGDVPCVDCNSANPGYVVNPLITTTYTLSVTNANGCVGTASITIKVVDDFKLPNAFSPNGDGVNDTWNVKDAVFYDQFNVEIFSRNGAKVFSDKNGAKTFDGTMNGKDLPVGVYYYIIDLGDGEQLKGSLTLIR